MRSVFKSGVFLLSLLPLLYMVWQAYLSINGRPNDLGAEPGKALVLFSGIWALRFLLLTLAITPIKELTGFVVIVSFRRILGLFCFFYAIIHFVSYLMFLLSWRWQDLWSDIQERPYITVGFLALLLLIPLAITSTQAMMRLLKRRWIVLHRLIYIVLLLVLIHFFWLTRSNIEEFITYLIIAILLMLPRLKKISTYFQYKKT